MDLPKIKPDPLGQSLFLHEETNWKEELKTGDCVLFSGSEFVSKIIKKLLHTPYSHVGMIVKMKDITKTKLEEQTEEIFVVEADWDDGDHFSDNAIYGIVANKFEDRMKSYIGDVIWVAPLKQPLSENQCKAIVDYVWECKNTRVKFDMSQGLKLSLHVQNVESPKSVFCSEFVAFALKKAGVIGEDVNPSNQDPYMVSKFPCFEHGQYPKTVLRYQVHVDEAKLKGSSLTEIKELIQEGVKSLTGSKNE